MKSRIIIKSGKSSRLNFKDLYGYKDLFLTLAYRDLKVRYAQTILGPAWVIFQPLITLLILTLVFEKAIGVNTGEIPYPLFALAGMCGWNYFSSVVNLSGTSIISAQHIITKIYFPRVIIPFSKAVVAFADFGVILLLFFLLTIIFGRIPGLNLLFLPFFILLTLLSALGTGLWLSALTIRYRDLHVLVPFLVQFGLYATPVAYSADSIPDKYKILFYLNPMTGIVEGYRWTLLNLPPPSILCFVSYGIAVLLFISGILYFSKTEKVMADIL